MKTLAHDGRTQRGDAGGAWAAFLVVVVLALAVWGAWRLGVMAGDKVDLRQGVGSLPTLLRKAPNPQPTPIPTKRRPAVATEARP